MYQTLPTDTIFNVQPLQPVGQALIVVALPVPVVYPVLPPGKTSLTVNTAPLVPTVSTLANAPAPPVVIFKIFPI